jgi:hypothetical protein
MNTTLRNVLFVLLLLGIMIAGLVWYFVAKPHPSLPTVGTSTPSTANTSNSDFLPANPMRIIEHGAYYDADIQYPKSTPLLQTVSTSANDAAVQAMKGFEQNTLASFKENGNFANLTPKDAQTQGLDQGRKYELTIGYQMYHGTNAVSYVFTIYEDTLGAHPNTYYRAFTFDLKTGQNLALSDLFTPSSNYLDTVSSLSRAALVKLQGSSADPANFINPGTTANADNFQNFAIAGGSLVIFFPPYQVAPYSSGPQVIQISLGDLSNILKASYK